MVATLRADILFDPVVWTDHAVAFFEQKLRFAAYAVFDDSLAEDARKGDTVTFPYWKMIGDFEEPTESTALTIDKLSDDKWTCSVKEVGKAIGWRDSAPVKAAQGTEDFESEAGRQIGVKWAKKVDDDLIAELNTVGNHVDAYLAGAATDKCNINLLNEAKFNAFGDQHEEVQVCFLHSQHVLSLINNADSGFLKADATMPLWGTPGFQGQILGMDVITIDRVPAAPDISLKKVFYGFMCKPRAYGVIRKKMLSFEKDRDILLREDVVAATAWYGVKAFHAKQDPSDTRIARFSFATGLDV